MENSDKNEILTAINGFSTKVDQRFDGVESRLDGVESRLSKVESTMVTKEYLDDKLADLRGDLTVLMRKEDRKLQALISVLVKNQVLSENDAQQILTMQPFPQFKP